MDRTTDPAPRDTTDLADAHERGGNPTVAGENTMADLDQTPAAMDAGPPFADWREQLRERVKEIRARRQASTAPVEASVMESEDSEIEQIDRRTTAAKLAQAREQAARAVAAVDSEPRSSQEPTTIELTAEDRSERRAEIGNIVDSFLHDDVGRDKTPTTPTPELGAELDATTGHDPAPEPAAALESNPEPAATPPAAAITAPSASMKALLEDTVSEAQAAARARPDGAARVLDPDAEPRIPAWARNPRAEQPIRTPAPPDLSDVPAEMQDVEIPAWALPHPHEADGATATKDPATPDVHLVGEFAAGAGRTVDSTPDDATVGPPRRADKVAIEPERDPVRMAETHASIEPGSRETAANPERRGKTVPASSSPERRFPGLFVPEADPPAATGSALLEQLAAPTGEGPSEPHAATPELSDLESRGLEMRDLESTGEPLAWDLDAPVDPNILLDAQRQTMDPSAPLSDRVFSAIADGLVLLTVGLLLAIGGASAADTPLLPFVAAAPLPLAVAWCLFGFVYGMMFIGTCGQTLGKMAMRVRVIGADRFRVGYARAAGRTMFYALASLPVFLGLLPALRDPEHRAMHDRLTGTRVVKA